MIYRPEGQISVRNQILFQTRYRRVSAEDIVVSLNISSTTYSPGDLGVVNIQVGNNTDKELTLDSVMFETKKKFFDGFVVDYESADPPISERKEKLGLTIAFILMRIKFIYSPAAAMNTR